VRRFRPDPDGGGAKDAVLAFEVLACLLQGLTQCPRAVRASAPCENDIVAVVLVQTFLEEAALSGYLISVAQKVY